MLKYKSMEDLFDIEDFQNLPNWLKLPIVFIFFILLTAFLVVAFDPEKLKQKEE